MSTIKINDIELELNLLDADVLEKYQNLNSEFSKSIREPTQYEGISAADAIRKQCRYVDKFFDDLFGEGTAERVFGNTSDLGVRIDAFAQVSAAPQNARSEFTSIADKYGIGRIEQRSVVHQNSKHKKHKYNFPRNFR